MIGSRFRKGMAGVTSCLSLCLAAFLFTGHGLGLGWKYKGLIFAFQWMSLAGDGLHSLSSPRLV